MIKNRIKVAKTFVKLNYLLECRQTSESKCKSSCCWCCLCLCSRFQLQQQVDLEWSWILLPLLLAWPGQSLLLPRRCNMCKGLGFSTGFVALCAFICCFGALHMLNKIVHINGGEETALRAEFTTNDRDRCQRTFIVDNANGAHLTWLELFYMKWTLVLTIFYSFIVMVLIRAQYLSHFDINFITSNAMMLVGGVLSVVLFIATVILHERMPFMEVWCNEFIVGFMYFIAINVCVAVVFFLIHSCQYYFQLEDQGYN